MKKKHLNFVDIILILLVLAIALAVYFIIHGSSSQETISCTYVVEVQDLDRNMKDLVKIGDPVADNIRNYNLGTVTDVQIHPYTMSVLKENQNAIVNVPVDGRVNLLLTIEVDTVQTEQFIYTENQFLLRIGAEVNFNTGGLYCVGRIVDIKR